ncbi:glycosyltransferase [Polynucleobacter sp. AP-RePozz3-80-G7]|uniref:glycosyltransferase n=1 Tax=Polynucleobacter sp. AP-RePozz3-80-G7 TaxID=2689105 RepID=UPI001C0A94E5|nr:glycosyltransferase [Polynucleobacter sp. AP-RePozz3-80-G7]MBU3638552.1 glycosyltransferase [Polynucleobacter sp. AP-RePozz3-80-G7]
MKILFLVEAGGGVGRHLADLISGLLKEGDEVTLIFSPTRVDKEFLIAIKKLEALGLSIVEIRMKRSPSLCDFYVAIRLLIIAVSRGPFDIIHGHSSKGGALARIIAFLTGSKSVYTPHAFFSMNPGLSALKLWLFRKIEYLFGFISDAIIVTSKQEHLHALELGISKSITSLIYNGSDPQEIEENKIENFRSICKIENPDFIFGFVGRLEYQKAPDLLINAFFHLIKTYPDSKLIMVGDGVLRSQLIDLVHSMGLSERILFPGVFPSCIAMKTFDVFVLPSRYEGSPYVLYDAALAGLPIVSTPVGGADILVRDGENGYIVEQGDLSALVNKMTDLIVSKSKIGQMGLASRNLVIDYSISRMVRETKKLYLEICFN